MQWLWNFWCRFLSRLCAAQNRPDPSDEFARIERLRQIIIGSNFQTYNSIDIFPSCREQQHRNLRCVANLAQNIETIHSWQHHIKHNQSIVTADCPLQTPISVVNRLDLKSLWFQVLAHQSAELHIIVDD